jgi:DNA repair protein RadC
MVLKLQIPEFKLSFKTKVKSSELFHISSSADVAHVCRMVFDEDTIEWLESFVLICLNRANKVVGFTKISQGGVTGTVADPRVILQHALLTNATSIILAHNHPSGSLRPSRADEEMTQKIKTACSYFDIKMLDHIIVTADEYFSFVDEGILY